jgi:drug/metabolite transporter (DMT)-like permease
VLPIFALLLTAICLTVAGELFLKAGVNRVGEFSPNIETVWRTFTEWRVVLGFALIFGGALFWLGVISRVDFSFAYPMLALSYVISMIPAYYLLNEQITINKIIGACIIVLGVVVISWSGRPT